MPKDKDFKRLVRDRMRETGQRYSEARDELRPDAQVDSGGRLRGVLEFPEGSDLGTVHLTNLASRSYRKARASGFVEVADGERVRLVVHRRLDLDRLVPSREELAERPELFDEVMESVVELNARAPAPDLSALDVLDEALIDSLSLDATGDARDVAKLVRFRTLEYLDLRHMDPFPDEAFAPLRTMTWLDRLLIFNTGPTDAVLAHLPIDALQHLELPRCGITDDGAREIAKHRRLQTVNLAETKLTDEGALALLELPDLARLQLADTAITDATVHAIARRVPSVSAVGVSRCEAVTEAAVDALRAANPQVHLQPPFTRPFRPGATDGARGGPTRS